MGFKKIKSQRDEYSPLASWILQGVKTQREKYRKSPPEIPHRVERLVDLGRIYIKMLIVVVSTWQEFMEFSCLFYIFLDCLNSSSS